MLKSLVSIADLQKLTNVSDGVISDSISRQLNNLLMVAIAPDRSFDAGDEYPIQSLKIINSLRYGSLDNFYVASKADIPANRRIILKGDSPYDKALKGYQKEEIYELCVLGNLPQEIYKDLVGHGFSYTYQGQAVNIYVELKEDDEKCWEAILQVGWRRNSLNLKKFRLVKPWFRGDFSSSSEIGGEVGIGSWSDKGYY